jgi:hypothetical protein
VFPGAGTVQKYAGGPGLLAYLTLGLPGLAWASPRFLVWLGSRTGRGQRRAGLAAFALLALIFAGLYPLADSGAFGGGSDADDALDLGGAALLAGRYPYRLVTGLGNPLGPLPGAILLAVPFVALGASALQNLFWLALSTLALARSRGGASGLGALVLVLVGCPATLQNLVTGTDHLANGIYVLLAVGWIASRDFPASLAGAALLGLGLSSRSIFLAVLPPLAALLHRRFGGRGAALRMGAALAVGAVVTVPFWLHDPEAFTPLRTQAVKSLQFHGLFPGAGLLAPGLALLLAVGVAVSGRIVSLAALARAAAWVLAVPPLAAVVLESVAAGALDCRFAGYGVLGLAFAVTGYLPGPEATAAPTD